MPTLNALVDKTSRKVGETASLIILPMVALTFLVVVLRYVFGFGRVWLQELIIYFHATFFTFGLAYSLLKNTHVRVDVFYNKFSKTTKSKVEIFGCLFFAWPVTLLIFFKSLPYVKSSLLILESSSDAGGLPGRFILKSLIPIFCILIFLQSVSIVLKHFKLIYKKQG